MTAPTDDDIRAQADARLATDPSAALLGGVADWVWEQDAEFRFIRVEGACAECAEPDRADELIGRTRWEIGLSPAEVDVDWAAHRALLATQQPFRDVIMYREQVDGSRIYLSISGVPVFDDGRFVGYRGIGRDVSANHRQYDELLRFRAAMDASPDLIFLTDVEAMRLIYVNQTACRNAGYSYDEFLDVHPSELIGLALPELRDLYARVIASGDEGISTPPTFNVSKDGSRKGWWEAHWRAIRNGDRWIVVTVSREISDRVLAEEATLRAQRMYAALIAINEAILRAKSAEELCQKVCDAAVHAGKFAMAAMLMPDPESNALQATAVAGYGRRRLAEARMTLDPSMPQRHGLPGIAFRTGKTLLTNDFAHDPRTEVWHAAAEKIALKSAAAIPVLRDGRAYAVLFLCSSEKRAFDREIVTLLERMTENVAFGLDRLDHEAQRREAEQRIQYIATHDALTGLPNRVLFNQILGLAISTAQRYKRGLAVMFIDLDRFKLINDTLGHDAGDALLAEIAARLKAAARASDVVSRLGGDEFVVLLQEVTEPEDAATVAHKILAAAIEPVVLLGQECRVTASIGIALYPEHGENDQALLKNADIAMYLAKEDGKNNFQFFRSGAKTPSLERLTLEANLRNALDRDQFVLYYQSKLDLKTGRVTGVEALLRWRHPEMGMIMPNQFIPLAEDMGVIVPIGRWVLKTACRQNMAWQRQGLPPIAISINLSARQFADDALLDDIAAALCDSCMPPELLELELTESMVMQDPRHAVATLSALKDMGVRIAIDDFGVGYSSLAQIKEFPVDTLKVDRSFIRNLPESAQDRSITEAIIAMAKTLSLTVVAEGVETEEQEAFLRNIACDQSQGFYFGRPVPAAEIVEQLRRQAGQGDG